MVEGDDMCLNIESGLGQALWNSLLGHLLHDFTDRFDISPCRYVRAIISSLVAFDLDHLNWSGRRFPFPSIDLRFR